MTRKIKALGLVLVAVLAMSAVAAAGAQAENIEHTFKSAKEKTNLTGVAEDTHVFTINGGSVSTECEEILFDGTVVGEEVDEVTIKPTYDKCKTSLGAAEVIENDCAYVFDSDTTTTEGVAEPHARVTIECAENNVIEIRVPTVGVTVTVGTTDENHNLHGVRYDNIEEEVETKGGTKHKEVEAITVDATVEKIHWTCKPAFLCGLGSIPSTGTDGTYKGKTKVTGYEDAGTATDPTTPELTHGGVVNVKMTTP